MLAEHAEVICLGETGDRRAMLTLWLLAHPDWGMFMGTTPGAGKVPVLYDKRALRLREESRTVVAWRGKPCETFGRGHIHSIRCDWVGPRGAGPTTAPAKGLTVACFDHLATGHVVNVLNDHLIASHTRLDLLPAERRKRRAVANRQIDVFERQADQCHGLVFGTADDNAPPRWVLERLPEYVIDSDGPTFRLRTIDHVGHYPNPAITVVGSRVLETSGSRKRRDHRAPVVDYLLTPL